MRVAYAFVLTSWMRILSATARPELISEYDGSAEPSLFSDQVGLDPLTDLFADSVDGLTSDQLSLSQNWISSDFNEIDVDSLDQDSLFISENGIDSQGNLCFSDAGEFELLGKREKGKSCSTPESTGSDFDADDFLNKLPSFDPTVSVPVVVGDENLCPPHLVGKRQLPICFSGKSPDVLLTAFEGFDLTAASCITCMIFL